jgi:hypothetical protein
MEGEEMDSPGKVLKMLNSPFSKERDFWSFLYLFGYAFFSLFLLLCSISLLRMNSGIFEIFEDKTIFFKLSFKWVGSGYTKICEIGGVVENLSAVDLYLRMDLCTPTTLLLGEARSKIS